MASLGNQLPVIVTGSTGTILRNLSIPYFTADFRKVRDSNLPQTSFDLLHGAGIVGEWNVTSDLELSIRVNVDDTLFLAREFLEKSERGRFFFMSTGHIYGSSVENASEETTPNPGSTYSRQKLEAEQRLTELFAGEAPSRLSIVRVFSILDLFECKPGTLGDRISRALLGDAVTIRNSHELRSFMRPSVVAKILQSLVKKCEPVPKVLNICPNSPESIKSAISKIFIHHRIEVPKNLKFCETEPASNLTGNNRLLVSTLGQDPISFP